VFVCVDLLALLQLFIAGGFFIMLFFIIFILSCVQDNYLTHEVEKIQYEVITETEYVYVQDTSTPPPQDTSLDLLPIWVDSFLQPNSVNGIDILWVIDRSGSMTDDANTIVTGIETMIAALPETDWRLVMINISSNYAAMSQIFPLIPGDGSTEAWIMYNSLGNSNREEGFNAVYEYIMDNPYSQTWMRQDASLLIVFVSDEEEQSFTQFPAPVNFTNWLGGYRQDYHITSIVHVEVPISLCNNVVSNVGTRYLDAADSTGGTRIDICSTDWTAGIAEALDQVEPFEHFDLTKRVKYPQYLQVFYNGIPADPTTFRYEPTENRVYFNPLPDGGVLVEIAYYYQPLH
jgi:hypothetical protein